MTVFTAGDDDEQLSHGVYDAYTKRTSPRVTVDFVPDG
jgi:hypothetical protein